MATGWTRMLAYSDRFVCFDAATRAFLGRSFGFNLHDVCAVQVSLVFQQSEKP